MKPIIFLLLSVFTLLSPKNCWAQNFSLSINPPLLEAMLKPGKKIIYTLFKPFPLLFLTIIKNFA